MTPTLLRQELAPASPRSVLKGKGTSWINIVKNAVRPNATIAMGMLTIAMSAKMVAQIFWAIAYDFIT